MKPKQLDRREFLAAAGGTLIALPMLEAFLPYRALAASATSDPRRFVALHMENGTVAPNNHQIWNGANPQQGALNASALGPVIQPFTANFADFSVIFGVGQRNGDHNGDSHGDIADWLTCASVPQDGSAFSSGTTSIDTLIAKATGKKALVMSCEGGVGGCTNFPARPYCQALSYDGGRPASMYTNPASLFSAIFPGGVKQAYVPSARALLGRLRASVAPTSANGSVLDSGVAAIQRLMGRVGPSDKQRLDDFYTSFRDLEARLQAMAATATPTPIPMPSASPTGLPASMANNQCTPGYSVPGAVSNEDSDGTESNFGQRIQAFLDITVLSFKCDIARTATLSYESEAGLRVLGSVVPSNLVYGQGDVSQGNLDTHLSMSHWSDSSGTPGPGTSQQRQDRCVTRDRFYISQAMYLVNQLKAATDPSGAPMLDNTAIMTGHSCADGGHLQGLQEGGLPMVLAGGRNFLSPGNLHHIPGTDMSDFLTTLASKIAGINSFGGSGNTGVKI